MLATASIDKTAKVLDFNTGKVLFSDKTSDGSKFYSIKLIYSHEIMRFCVVSLLYLSKNQTLKAHKKKIEHISSLIKAIMDRNKYENESELIVAANLRLFLIFWDFTPTI